METTTNYGLKKYQVGDLFNPLTVNNPNFDDIDTDMKAISERAVGRATELVSQGIHAITVLDTDCKTIKWVATANFTAGETFTVNGIQCNAYLPSGEALGTNAYVSGAQVIASLNDDNSAMTVYVPQGSVAVASDSERLGGELPSYYATKSYADGIKSTADTASSLIQKKALVNTYYDSSAEKLYQINSDGTIGGEIVMSKELDFDNAVELSGSVDFTTSIAGVLLGRCRSGSSTPGGLHIGNIALVGLPSSSTTFASISFVNITDIPSGVHLTSNVSVSGDSNNKLYFVPYK